MAEEEKKEEKKETDSGSGAGEGAAPPTPPSDDEDDDEGGGGGAPGWLATFADLVTLLMCFFVLLFAMSSTQEESFKELVQSLKSALGVQQVPEAGTREGLSMPMPESPEEEKEKKPEAVDEAGAMVQKEVDQIVSDVRELVMFNQLGGMVKVEGDEMGATITISDVVLFPPGESTMSRDGLEIMRKIANVLAQFNYHIKIAGHTDNAPISTARFPSNWELSANRACEIVRYLAKTGIDPKQMSAEGYAKYRPIATNVTAEGRAQNRRVEILYERRQIANTLSKKL